MIVVMRLPRLLLLLTTSAAASFYLPLFPTKSTSTNFTWHFAPPSRICRLPGYAEFPNMVLFSKACVLRGRSAFVEFNVLFMTPPGNHTCAEVHIHLQEDH